jgi:hypothetical protein
MILALSPKIKASYIGLIVGVLVTICILATILKI